MELRKEGRDGGVGREEGRDVEVGCFGRQNER